MGTLVKLLGNKRENPERIQYALFDITSLQQSETSFP